MHTLILQLQLLLAESSTSMSRHESAHHTVLLILRHKCRRNITAKTDKRLWLLREVGLNLTKDTQNNEAGQHAHHPIRPHGDAVDAAVLDQGT